MVTAVQLLPVVKQVESAGNPSALSPRGAAGAYQIMPATAANPGYGVTPLQNWDGQDPRTAPPEEQERFARDYLQAMAALHGGDVKLALASYNAGPGAVKQAGNTVPNYPETQNYVNKITQGTDVATSTVLPANAAVDWRAQSQLVTAPPVDWRAQSQPVEAPGTDLGAGAAAVQGFNSAVPFGERVAAGLGAGGAYTYDKLSGLDSGASLSDYYREGRQAQEKTAAENPGAYTAGALTGVAATLPLLSTKVLTGTRATTGVRGAVNAIPEALGAVGNYVRGGKVAAEAGTAAKLANVAGKAVRAAAVSAPAGALYAYGGSRNDLDSQGALDDAKTGAAISAALGAAVPVAGAALSKIPKPNVSETVKQLAATAKDKFGIDLSLDQIAPSSVRDTVQKISQNIPGSGVDSFQTKQASQWMRGVAKTIGEDSDNLAPEVINNYLARAGKDFEKPLAGKTINFTQADINDLADVAIAAKKKISTGLADVVKNNVDEVLSNLSKFKVGEARNVPGEKLASLRSQLLQDLPSIEGGARQQVAKLIDKIDAVVGRHLSPAETKQLATARLQWRNFRTLEPLLEKSTDGMINPTQLKQKVASSKYIKASRKAIGEDDLVDLANIGAKFMAKKGGSDTAQKLAYMKVGGAGLTGGVALQNIPLALGGVAANRGYQKLVNQSPKVVERLVKNRQGSSVALPVANLLGAQMAPGSITKTR